MRSMKLWMSLVALSAVAAGCGGSPSEKACDSLESSLNDLSKKIADCTGAKSDGAVDFDTKSCVQAMDKCADGEAKKVADYFECSLDALTCTDLTSDDDSAYAAKVQACADKYKPSAACVQNLDDVNVGGNAAAREALRQLKSSR
jgi:hypothetical protein